MPVPSLSDPGNGCESLLPFSAMFFVSERLKPKPKIDVWSCLILNFVYNPVSQNKKCLFLAIQTATVKDPVLKIELKTLKGNGSFRDRVVVYILQDSLKHDR